MLFRPILSSFAALGVVSLLSFHLNVPQAQAQARGDSVLVEMNQAYKKGDKRRLTALLPQALGHALEPWAAYWELRARLEEASSSDVQNFLNRYAGTYQEDRLRADWLLQSAKKRDWDNFSAEYPKYRMGDDKEIRCYAIVTEIARSGATAAQADEVQKNWLAQKDVDEGCALAAEQLVNAKLLSTDVVWRKARVAMEAERPRSAKRAADIAGTGGDARRELAVLDMIKLAQSDADGAEQLLQGRAGLDLEPAQRNWVWAVLGKRAAYKLAPEGLTRFERITRDADLNDDLLAWKTRSLLRATATVGGINSNVQGRWMAVAQTIDAMSEDAKREPTWVYWKARSLQMRGKRVEATALYDSIASVRGFYEQLALEALNRKITVPAAPAPLTVAEKEAVKSNPGLTRALYAIQIGLRPEGVREWNYSTNLVNAQGQSGSFSERELLAAADMACTAQVWDRCINTSERTKTEFDASQRFPMPHKDAVVAHSTRIGVDPAYVYGLIRQESRFVTNSRSGVGASGLMQVMPATARWTAKKIGLTNFTADQINNRDTNITIGTAYLKLALDDFSGSMPLAAAAYNAGPSRPRAWRNGPVMEGAIWTENIPFGETRDYVKKVVSNTAMYAAIITGQPQSLQARMGQVGPRDAAQPVNVDLP